MSLTLEDGTGVANANAFVTAAEARTYASLRGVTLSATDSVVEAFLVKATDYLKQFSYLGTKTNAGQAYLPWPRSGLEVDDEDFDEDTVPNAIKDAQCELVIAQHQGVVLFANTSAAAVKRERVGPLETEYVGSNTKRVHIPAVDAILRDWIVPAARGLRTTRI